MNRLQRWLYEPITATNWSDDEFLPLHGWWKCESNITPEQLEHDKPLLLEAMRRGNYRVLLGKGPWWRQRLWTFHEQKP